MIPLLLASLLQASPAHAGDKIGNGGGVWACYTAAGELETARLVDFYEAEAQYDRPQVPAVRQDPVQIAADIAASVRSRFPDYAPGWIRELDAVQARFHLLPGVLREINDVHWIAEPEPSSCHGRPWQFVQFANYDDDRGLIQVRKELWESPRIAPLEKAGLLWHEAIYRWMRDNFSDDTSIRSREIVGILFSGLDGQAARQALDTVLKHDPGHSPTDPTFVCTVRNGISNRWFLDYGTNELMAKNQTLKTCKLADPAIGFHCEEFNVRCDSFTSQKQAYTCAVTNGLNNEIYTETGRSAIEAEAKARRACSEANPSLAVHCRQPVCQ